MKITFAVCMLLLMLSVSCKKSNDQPNTPPVLIDTTKPPVVKVDTSTLLKTVWSYSYNASGTAITDSSNMQFKYDDQRRLVQQIDNAYPHVDTFSYTYLSDRYVVDFHVSNAGSPMLVSSSVYYQHIKNRTDSLLTTATGYGIQAGQGGTYATYFYYNQAGLDSLEKGFQNTIGQPQYKTTINYYYTGTNLDSTMSRDNNGKLSDISYYTGGNRTVDKWYAAGVQQGIENLSYSNIPNGGLYVVYKSPKLLSQTVSTPNPPGTVETDIYTYQMDAANRVAAMTISSGGITFLKQVFTYY